MYIDIEEEIKEAAEDYLANGGNRVITYEEYSKLIARVEKIEKEWADFNYWKANRNHTHTHVNAELKELRRLWEETEAEVIKLKWNKREKV